MNNTNEDSVAVTVCVSTYKHAKYIRKCLDSILSQKFNHNFEVIVCDDCSNDGTAEILKEYEKKYPNKFKAIINEQNLGVSRNSLQGRKIAKGKYTCGMEGDDWWCDEYRLQKQFDFLENHKEYSAVGCNNYFSDPQGNIISTKLKKNQTNKAYKMKYYLKYGYTVHGNSLMYHSDIFPVHDQRYVDLRIAEPTMGDMITRILLYDRGPIYVLSDVMLVHRDGTKDQTSFSAQNLTKAIYYSYMYCRIVDNITKYLDYKYDLSAMKANRTALMLQLYHFSKAQVKIDKNDLKRYLKSMPLKVRIWARLKLVRNMIKAVFKKIAKK